MAKALLSLGANLGNRAASLGEALARLRTAGLRAVRLSRVYETEPVGGAGPGWFLNIAAVATTSLPPREALEACLSVERDMGRVRRGVDAPREIDIDLLAWEAEVIREEGITLPHPRMHLRRFVLAPLAEIAPDWTHPLRGSTVLTMLSRLGDVSAVRPAGRLDAPGGAPPRRARPVIPR